MAANVKWYGAAYKRKLNRHINRNLDTAAIFLASNISDSFGNSGVSGSRSGATKGERAANRSRPWGPPNVDTGHLQRSIGYDKPVGRPLSRRVGTGIGNKASVGYALWLEFGTRNMLPRPFLRPALFRNKSRLRRIMSRPMVG